MNTPASKPNQETTNPAGSATSKSDAGVTAGVVATNVAPLKAPSSNPASEAVKPLVTTAAAASPVMPKPSAPYGTPAKPAPGLVAAANKAVATKPVAAKPVSTKIEEPKPAKTQPNSASSTAKAAMDARVERADKNNFVNASIGVPSLPLTGMLGNVYDNQMQVFKMVQNMFTNVDEISEIGKANAEAMLKSTQIVAKGIEDLSKAVFSFAQNSMQSSIEMSQAYAGVKTLKDLTDLQKQGVQKNFDSMVAEGTKISEMSVKVANDAFEPINARINELMSKLAKTA